MFGAGSWQGIVQKEDKTRNNTANSNTQTLGLGLGWALEVCNYSSSDRIIAKSAAETESDALSLVQSSCSTC